MSKMRKRIMGLIIVLFCSIFMTAIWITFSVKTAAAEEQGQAKAQGHNWEHAEATELTRGGMLEGGETGETVKRYYLSDNVELDTNLAVSGYVELCLNGYMLTGAGNRSVINVGNGARFTLVDCCPDDCGNGEHKHNVDGKTVYGGVITGGDAEDGGGMKVNGEFTMNGGKIFGNRAENGGGVLVRGTFTMTGGSITGNTASGEGGGVYINYSAEFTMTGGTITGNVASTYGGGVFALGTFNVGGAPDISGNTKNNVYLPNGTKINVFEALEEGANIGVTLATVTGKFTSDWNKSHGDPSDYFKADNAAKDVVLYGGAAAVYAAHYHGDELFVEVIDEFIEGTILKEGKYFLNGDFDGNLTIRDTVDLCMDGCALTGTGSGPVVTVNTGANFTLYDCCVGADCESESHEHDLGGETVYGGVITGGNAENGGGVYVNGGTFTMNGGTVFGNEAENGGGVLVKGTFNMNGGSITGNTASGEGGGVCVNYGAAFTMTGGTVTGNTASTYGGGVFAIGIFNVSGTPGISGNSQSNVYLSDGNTIKIVGALEAGANIGVTLKTGKGTFTSGYKDSNDGDAPKDYFFSDADYCLHLSEDEVCLDDHTWEWVIDNPGDANTPRTQIRECEMCGKNETRTLVLSRIAVTADDEYSAKDTALTNVTVTAYFKVAGGDDTEIEYAVSSGEYEISEFANGEYLTVQDTSVTFSYTIGGETVTDTVAIIVNALSDEIVGTYARADWHENKEPSAETLPETTAAATIRYYKDEECEEEFTGDFADAPAGTYYVKLTTSDPDYVAIDAVIGSFTITAHDFEGGGTDHIEDTKQHKIYCTVEDCDKYQTEDCEDFLNPDATVEHAATCTEGGYTEYECLKCGAYTADETEALDHSYDEGKVTKEPGCTEKGERTYSCIRGDHSYAEEIDALDHSWDEGKVTLEPTATEDGVRTFTCERCNAEKTENISATGEIPSGDNDKNDVLLWVLIGLGVILLGNVCILVRQLTVKKKNKGAGKAKKGTDAEGGDQY